MHVAALTSSENVNPTAHAVHARSSVGDPSALLPDPIGHVRQGVHHSAPAAEKWPDAHGTQTAAPAAALKPAPHCEHDALPAEAAYPAPHRVQTPAPSTAAQPALHFVRDGPPLQAWPAGQASHTRLADALGGVASNSLEAHALTVVQAAPLSTSEYAEPTAHGAQAQARSSSDRSREVACGISHVARRTSHVARRISHVANRMSHVARREAACFFFF